MGRSLRGGERDGGYGQFCPVAKAMELLDERWTMLVVRERTLARAGVIERYEDGNRVSSTLTPAGKELRPIVEALGSGAPAGCPTSGTRTWTRTC